jgi:hypothetical protein
VRRVRGVKGVSNMIAVEPRAKPAEIQIKIQEAFRRNAEVDANRIVVETNGSEVILNGTVRSWLERHGSDIAQDFRKGDIDDQARRFAPDGVDAVLALAGGDALERCLNVLRSAV